MVAITSDAHQNSALDYVEIGSAQARRAWLTKVRCSTPAPGRN